MIKILKVVDMKVKIFLIIIAFLYTNVVFAQNIKIPVAFKASFIQQVKNNKGKIIKYRGKIFFNSPSETKWIYNSPTKKEVCTSGRRLVVIDHDLEQVSYYSIDKRFNLSKVLRDARLYKGNIYTTKFKGKLYTVVVNKRGEVQQIAYKDNLDNTVNLIFTRMRYLRKLLPSSKFVCARPKNYDTIY